MPYVSWKGSRKASPQRTVQGVVKQRTSERTADEAEAEVDGIVTSRRMHSKTRRGGPQETTGELNEALVGGVLLELSLEVGSSDVCPLKGEDTSVRIGSDVQVTGQ